MIKEIKEVRKKYEQYTKIGTEYVSINQVVNDLYRLENDIRIKRLPKSQR